MARRSGPLSRERRNRRIALIVAGAMVLSIAAPALVIIFAG